jgi:hypothetical protein
MDLLFPKDGLLFNLMAQLNNRIFGSPPGQIGSCDHFEQGREHDMKSRRERETKKKPGQKSWTRVVKS